MKNRFKFYNDMAKIVGISNYKGMRCAELDNGEYVIQANTFELVRCERVTEGMKVIQHGIVGGIMMKTEEDFRWCVEHMN